MWSTRARQQIAVIRKEFVWLDTEGTVVLLAKHGTAAWWTFAGTGANAMLASAWAQAMEHRAAYDSFTVTCEASVSRHTVARALGVLRAHAARETSVAVEDAAIDGLKFSECLPRDLARDMLRTRLCDPQAVHDILEQPVRCVAV
jgi:ATP-dependent helicase Lhr and Lhr-like helicase